jgi:hypothetical protein
MLSATDALLVQPNVRVDCCAHATTEVEHPVKIAFRPTGRYLGDLSAIFNTRRAALVVRIKMGILDE